jgi:hypothetical protein
MGQMVDDIEGIIDGIQRSGITCKFVNHSTSPRNFPPG